MLCDHFNTRPCRKDDSRLCSGTQHKNLIVVKLRAMDRPAVGDVEDLATLARLDETILLEEVKARYTSDKIYTYVGDILLAVNPFKELDIYGKDYSARYQHTKLSSQPPHIFAVADAAYQALIGNGVRAPRNQCVLISGESGAGKTESTKLIIKQLVELCKGNTQLEQQILQVNPLLEAFGNAQTNLNDNSSRFGKYIQLKFNHGQLVGAKISEYLLEKSRVVRQSLGEENFHIFYYLFAPDLQKKYGLTNPNDYRYLSQGGSKKMPQKCSPVVQYENVVNAMDLVGFTDEEQEAMFAIIASVLVLGNVIFLQQEDESVLVTECYGPLKTAASLLGISRDELESSLTCMVTWTKGEQVKRNYNKEMAEDARDAMAKTLYGRLFGWIVNKINCLLAPEDQRESLLSEIGILDIFGFEDFSRNGGNNSFEQACINLANEQLQFFFNQHIFFMEQEEYKKEGIDWKEINFVDNKPLLDIFLKKPIGILSLLDEESLFPKGTDQSFVDKINKALAGCQYFVKSQQTNKAIFSINHYAGKVLYTCDSWLEKNRDTLPPGITEMLKSSSNFLIKTIFQAQISRTGSLAIQGRRSAVNRDSKMSQATAKGDSANRRVTVGAQFKNSLNILMERMMLATPMFVRCLKPNYLKQPGSLDTNFVLAQLLYTGMLETIEIRRKGFAVRPSFAHFVDKYKILVDYQIHGTSENCVRILKAANIQGFCIGKTKIFLKYKHAEILTDLLNKKIKAAVHIQRMTKGFLARRKLKRLKEHARLERDRLERERLERERIDQERQDKIMLMKLKYENEINTKKLPDSFSTGTLMEDDEILDDVPEPSKREQFGKLGSKAASKNWFTSTQTHFVMDQNLNSYSEWFHGIIPRKQAEKLLNNKILGCFLIRVSESRFGYTLSFKAETRCRHYMIDQLKNRKFILIGEPKVHRSLHDLIAYHKKNKISNWPHLLSVPCGQESGECDYSDLVIAMGNTYTQMEDEHSQTQDGATNVNNGQKTRGRGLEQAAYESLLKENQIERSPTLPPPRRKMPIPAVSRNTKL
ncbi:unnamed protein product [Lymnaea stagnalis]|uniref:Uncharacterized protein n=1 Tax=Lymnaea stagnalis TaxID=6523 RepID=A0AAV2I3T9_LYMST